MAEIFNETERRLRELVGVLDMAVLIATDVICEHDSHGMSKHDWQRRLIHEASRKLAENGQFAGRLSLFSDDELVALSAAKIEALSGEAEFEMARRGIRPSETRGTVVPDGEGGDEPD